MLEDITEAAMNDTNLDSIKRPNVKGHSFAHNCHKDLIEVSFKLSLFDMIGFSETELDNKILKSEFYNYNMMIEHGQDVA